MATTVTITKVVKDANGIEVFFSDGLSLSWMNISAIIQTRDDLDGSVDFTRRLAVCLWLAKDPDLSNEVLARKTYTFDLSAPAPIRVQ